ncbi:hypothetical protein R3I94_013431 [Phoxinus phoxinus]|uniref:Uncharacterized protein n=1 Tax=Phoxinus phoxinus TaxID=58324 RepID=A0AAN9GZZ6_9TELE
MQGLGREYCSQDQTALEISVPNWTISPAALELARYLQMPRVTSTTSSGQQRTRPRRYRNTAAPEKWAGVYSTALHSTGGLLTSTTNYIRHTQPWFRDKQTTSRRLAWNHSAHDTYSKDDNEQFPLNEICSKRQ